MYGVVQDRFFPDLQRLVRLQHRLEPMRPKRAKGDDQKATYCRQAEASS
jgi:hypothetical protein